jgi:hypothetical protein
MGSVKEIIVDTRMLTRDHKHQHRYHAGEPTNRDQPVIEEVEIERGVEIAMKAIGVHRERKCDGVGAVVKIGAGAKNGHHRRPI